jgi:hypothetical protein
MALLKIIDIFCFELIHRNIMAIIKEIRKFNIRIAKIPISMP